MEAAWLEREVFISGVVGSKSTRKTTARERVPKALVRMGSSCG